MVRFYSYIFLLGLSTVIAQKLLLQFLHMTQAKNVFLKEAKLRCANGILIIDKISGGNKTYKWMSKL